MPRGPLGPEQVRRIADHQIGLLRRDPIKAFRFSSDAQRRFTRALSAFDEVALRSGSRAGKTTIGAHCGVAMSRGEAKLDGVALPILGTPNAGVVLAKGRAMAKESVIKAYRKAVGDWPHRLEKVGNTIEAIWVRPNRCASDDWREWSSIRFFVEGGQSVAGMRLDWVHADEPPDWDAWMELRLRAHANRLFPRFITFTPIDKREWKPVREDFRGCGEPDGKDGKLEIRMSVYDNRALGPADIKAQERAAKGPLAKAKLLGEYVDLTATCPFDQAGLNRWVAKVKEPDLVRYRLKSGREVTWQKYHEASPYDEYLWVADPSGGIWDERGEHDPAGFGLVSRRRTQHTRPKLCARFNGYVPAFELGELAAHLGRTYKNALGCWERNGGYGEAFYLGLGGYGNVYVEYHEDTRNMPLSERVGWLTTATTRGTIISALQKAILEDGLLVESREAVESLQEVIVDKNNKIIAGAGSHDEDMIVLGLCCHLLETLPLRSPPPSDLDLARRAGLIPRERVGDDSMDAAEW